MDVDKALNRCPFLHNLAQTQGRAFASSIAINPLLQASSGTRRPILQEEHDFAATFRLFHGHGGVVPLAKPLDSADISVPACDSAEMQMSSQRSPTLDAPPRGRHTLLTTAPLATMSIHGMPDFGDFFRKLTQSSRQPKPKVRKPANTNRSDTGRAAASSSGSQTVQPPSASSSAFPAGSASSASAGGACPLRKFLGPMAGVVFTKAGNLQCPTPIIQARAMLAATAPVRSLRPQALPIKLIAVGAVAAMANIPCGMWREHTKKFSWQWFMAVHASIPFIAMLRKAVIMPKLAIVCTIAAAIAGQAMGARLERQRLQQEQEQLSRSGGLLPAPVHITENVHVRTVVATPVVKSKAKVVGCSTVMQIGSSDQLPTDAAGWRMDAPGQGHFKQLLPLPLALAAR